MNVIAYTPAGRVPAGDVLARFRVARTLRQNWEPIWRDCSDYTLPYHTAQAGNASSGPQRNLKLYDATASDCIDQLASSLLAQLTPPWSSWIAVQPGPMAGEDDIRHLAPILKEANEILQGHFDRSNFTVEIHQAFLDLVTYGTACIRFDETDPGELSAFRFQTTPLDRVFFLDTANGFLDTVFCLLRLSHDELIERFPHVAQEITEPAKDIRHTVLYAVTPHAQSGYTLSFILDPENSDPLLLEQMHSVTSPFTAFRWQKSSGEVYGRSPVMKALPDIKTANKVVELILKNASISVTGIWMADDDGILNPANITLTPGAIIPKAVGSAGLTPLKMPGNFDVSQLVLNELRQKIRYALMGNLLSHDGKQNMTATEVLERQAHMIQMLGATYGRLQCELLTPIALRALSILSARGEIPDLVIDGRMLALDYRSPLARAQSQRDVQATLSWLQTARQYGDTGLQSMDIPATLHYLARALGVPPHLVQAPLQQQ